jgi:hypothetical protein
VEDEGDALGDAQRLQQGVEVAAVLDDGVGARAARRQLVRVAHPDQVGGDQAAESLEVREDVAPQVRGGGVAVQEDDGVALADVDVGHRPAQDPGALLGVGEGGADRGGVDGCIHGWSP